MFIFFVFFFTCVPSHLPFWRRATDRAQKSCARQFPWQYHAVAWEETKCISQYRDNVTESVIRAFKLAAHPKHCQILCERGNILTALSPLILCVWEKKSARNDLHDIDGKKYRDSHNIVDRFFVFLHPPLWLPWCHFILFFSSQHFAVLPFFLTLILFSSTHPFSFPLLQVQMLESLSWLEQIQSRRETTKRKWKVKGKKRQEEERRERRKFFRKQRERKRRGRWGGKRFRSHGLWMNATDRWVPWGWEDECVWEWGTKGVDEGERRNTPHGPQP